MYSNPPAYLKDYSDIYAENPREAAKKWFQDARYGLFIHYGLYSLLGRHEWIQLREKIPVKKYEQLKNDFTAKNFDAEKIVQFAEDAGMKYINITTRHHESFCLFETEQTDFNSINAPAGRDLIAELANACDRRGMGLCLYYSHGRDWKHPHAPNNDKWGGSARPQYDPPETSYFYGAEHDLNKYLEFMSAQVKELLTKYSPVAAIWLDGIGVPLSGDYSLFKCQELYDLIHSLQPQTLVSYKQGLLGTEDFFAPEHQRPGEQAGNSKSGKIKDDKSQIIEICTTMTPGSWGYMEEAKGKHKSAEEVFGTFKSAVQNNCNLLLNMALLPDGSLDPEDTEPIKKAAEAIGDMLC